MKRPGQESNLDRIAPTGSQGLRRTIGPPGLIYGRNNCYLNLIKKYILDYQILAKLTRQGSIKAFDSLAILLYLAKEC